MNKTLRNNYIEIKHTSNKTQHQDLQGNKSTYLIRKDTLEQRLGNINSFKRREEPKITSISSTGQTKESIVECCVCCVLLYFIIGFDKGFGIN